VRGARPAGFGALVLLFALAQVALHERAGFTFPPPWIDEAQFLWQAKAFADGGSLLAPQLHPARPILWMPPGWFVVTGAAFRAFGFDFALARGLSCAFLLAAFLLLASLLRALPHPRAALLLAGAFFLGPTFVAAGNVARMEALLLCAAFGGFVLLRAGRPTAGLALLAAGPLVHPNGLWFLGGGVAFAALRVRRAQGWPHPRALELAAVAAVAAAWLAALALALANREAFLHDVGYQLARKAAAGELERVVDGRLLGLLALPWLAWRLRRAIPDAALLACLAAPAYLATALGQEYWYEVFESLFLLLLGVLALEAALLFAARWPPAARRPRAALALALAALLAAAWAGRRVPDPFAHPASYAWHGMRLADGEPYLAPEERALVRELLIGLAPPGALPRVRFHPAAEALFYADLDGREMRVSQPLFHDEAADWIVLRTSRWHTSGRAERAAFQRAGIEPPDATHLIHRRDDSERWYAVRSR
jgi:hypothetical protein